MFLKIILNQNGFIFLRNVNSLCRPTPPEFLNAKKSADLTWSDWASNRDCTPRKGNPNPCQTLHLVYRVPLFGQ